MARRKQLPKIGRSVSKPSRLVNEGRTFEGTSSSESMSLKERDLGEPPESSRGDVWPNVSFRGEGGGNKRSASYRQAFWGEAANSCKTRNSLKREKKEASQCGGEGVF